MTVLTVIQAVAPKVGISPPNSVYGSTAPNTQELAALANEVADRVAVAYDWNYLKRLNTMTGDATTTAWSLPTDYSRMPVKQAVYSSLWDGPIRQVLDHDQWLNEITSSYASPCLSWTLLGGQIVFNPAPASGELLKHYYISDLFARSSGTGTTDYFPYDIPIDWGDDEVNGVRKSAFTEDTDLFALDDRLLRLGMIWQWKADKGRPYAEDMQNYEIHLAQRIAKDRGPRILRQGTPRMLADEVAYPYPLG